MTVNMEVGLCHPPVGLNLYVASGIAKMGITELTIAVWPWLATMLVFLVIGDVHARTVAVAAAAVGDAVAKPFHVIPGSRIRAPRNDVVRFVFFHPPRLSGSGMAEAFIASAVRE